MLVRHGPAGLTIWFEDRPVAAQEGESVAVALLAAGVHTTRLTAVSGARRGPYCLMGACFECLAMVDGRANVQTCMTPVREGMRVRRQPGAKVLASGSGGGGARA
jgi:predicted molibdopterin-dependent oxidoreductase YjgC